jgi:hypothetical protein
VRQKFCIGSSIAANRCYVRVRQRGIFKNNHFNELYDWQTRKLLAWTQVTAWKEEGNWVMGTYWGYNTDGQHILMPQIMPRAKNSSTIR